MLSPSSGIRICRGLRNFGSIDRLIRRSCKNLRERTVEIGLFLRRSAVLRFSPLVSSLLWSMTLRFANATSFSCPGPRLYFWSYSRRRLFVWRTPTSLFFVSWHAPAAQSVLATRSLRRGVQVFSASFYHLLTIFSRLLGAAQLVLLRKAVLQRPTRQRTAGFFFFSCFAPALSQRGQPERLNHFQTE